MGAFSRFKEYLDRKIKRVNVQERFDLAGTAGQGSMSKVYWARDKKLGRVVCVKLLDKALTARLEASLGLKRPSEGAMALGLEHPNIVRTYEYGLTTEGEEYIVMEMIEGKRLDELMHTKNKQLTGNRINFLVQVCKGLDYLHQHKLVHRDICPRNIMINHAGVAKIIDFGLSVPLSSEYGQTSKQAQQDIGRDAPRRLTPYMDPVMFSRAMADARIDLFSLGVTAYEILTGSLPWEKTDRVSLSTERMRDPRKLKRGLDNETAEFLAKAIDPDVAQRFHSTRSMQEGLMTIPAC